VLTGQPLRTTELGYFRTLRRVCIKISLDTVVHGAGQALLVLHTL